MPERKIQLVKTWLHRSFFMKKIPAVLLAVTLLLTIPWPASASLLTFYAGSGEFGCKDGNRPEAAFRFPYGLAVNKDNKLIVADSYNNRIRKIAGNEVMTVAGFSDSTDAFGFPAGGYADGEAARARFRNPRGVAVDSANNIYVADTGNHAIRKISGGKVTTFAGTGQPGYQDGPGNQARFDAPSGLAIDKNDNLYVADTLNNVIRRITPQGVVSTLAGEQSADGGYRDGPCGEARFNEPGGLALAGDGTLYVLDAGNQLVRKIKDLQVSTIAGSRDAAQPGTAYAPGGYRDGPGVEARFNFPKGIAVAPNGVVFIADTWNHRVRALTSDGEVMTVAGTGQAGRYADSFTSLLNGPVDVLYHDGALYISDMWNNALRVLPLDPDHLPYVYGFAPVSEKYQVWLNGKQLLFPDVEPYLGQEGVMLPLRVLCEKLGGQVRWLDREEEVVVKQGALEYVFTSRDITIKDGRALVPLRDLAGKMGFKVEWAEKYRAVLISF